MGRNKTNLVYRKFVLLDGGSAKCTVCDKILKTQHGANLLKHLKLHKQEYEEINRLNQYSSPAKQRRVEDTSNIVLEECTNLIAIHGRPFAILKDTAFKKIISLTGCNYTINSELIKENIKKKAAHSRNELAIELKRKQVCLKADVVSDYSKSYLGINIQFLENGQFILKNLAMIELLDRHTADHLKELIIFTMNRYRIDMDSIYSITTDNGANMIKMSRLLSVRQTEIVQMNPNYESNIEQHRANTNLTSGLNTFNISSSDSETENDASNIFGRSTDSNVFPESDSDSSRDFDGDTEMEYDHALEITFSEMVTTIFTDDFININTSIDLPKISVVRCVAHTIQLAVQDACKDTRIQETIASARNVVRRLRTPNFINRIKTNKKKLPILDCPTRWNSILAMIERLLYLRDFCESDPLLFLADDVWYSLQQIRESLEPAKVLTKVLQSEQLTMGDFYLQWLLCKFELKRLNTRLALTLFDCMESREINLRENDAFLNAIFVDPRLNFILDNDKQQEARNNLKNIYHKIFLLQQRDKENDLESLNVIPLNTSQDMSSAVSYDAPTTSRNNIPSTSRENILSSSRQNIPSTSRLDSAIPTSARLAKQDLNDFLNNSYTEKHNITTVVHDESILSQRLLVVEEEINYFLKEPLLAQSESVLQYWENKKNVFSELYKLALVTLGAPATQVSVERLFSSLKFVATRLRNNLKADLIEDILFLRSNALFAKSQAKK